jgi:hypothetical protein
MSFLFELFLMICAAKSPSAPHEPVVIILD